MNSCLVDALERGTGKAARAQFGLKRMPAAGKTGTAYDFTDVLFAGYDSAITCAVWAGFDKPQKIFRGAFGHDIALPVWVDVMNAALPHYPAKEIAQPKGVQRVEICSKSGQLATDKCVEKVKTSNGETEEKTTYMELATSAQKPTEPCSVHGETRNPLVHDLAPSEFPRAALAVDTTAVAAVVPQSPVLLAERDPYNSMRSTVVAKPSPTPIPSPAVTTEEVEKTASEEMPDPTKPVLKAQPVRPDEMETVGPLPTPLSVQQNTAVPSATPAESPIQVRRAIPVRRASPEATEPPVRRAQPVDPDEGD